MWGLTTWAMSQRAGGRLQLLTACLPLCLPALQEVAHMRSRWWWQEDATDAASAESAQAALAALSALTALHLCGTVTAPTSPAVALAGAARLELLCDRAHPRAVFGPDAWPDSLRCARLGWNQLLGARWEAGFGEQLRYLRIESGWGHDWSDMQRQPAWAAFWAWAAQAPDLRLLEVRALPCLQGGGTGRLLPCCRCRRPCALVQTRGCRFTSSIACEFSAVKLLSEPSLIHATRPHPPTPMPQKSNADHWLPVSRAADGPHPGVDGPEAAPPAAASDHAWARVRPRCRALRGHRSRLLQLRRRCSGRARAAGQLAAELDLSCGP